MHGRDTILHIQQHIIIHKAHVKFEPDWFGNCKGEKSETIA